MVEEKSKDPLIVDVWAANLDEELKKLSELVDDYPYIGMDTEFPGVVARPLGNFKTTTDYHYQTLKCNCDLLKIIQLGITLFDKDGNRPPGTCTWQFNFTFRLGQDMYAQDSIDLLERSGIDFRRHEEDGIDVNRFAELLITSGLVLMDNIRWLTFHSGYDFGYLTKLLTCVALPERESDFFELFHTYFPCVYDLKYMMRTNDQLNGGLNKLARHLQVDRVGTEHQAGSDSLLTGDAFFALKKKYFNDHVDEEYNGVLYGLGSGAPQHPYSRKKKTYE